MYYAFDKHVFNTENQPKSQMLKKVTVPDHETKCSVSACLELLRVVTAKHKLQTFCSQNYL